MQLCIALDMPSKELNLQLAKDIKEHNLESNIWLKVGLRSFIRDGNTFILELKKLGFKIFLDLKLYDIPNTMNDAFLEVMNLEVDLLTIHASSGFKALELLANTKAKSLSKIKLVAISALTSFSQEDFKQIYNDTINKSVKNMASLASKAGIDGMVCSVLESSLIKEVDANLLSIVPGIRPSFVESTDAFDQVRISSIKDAKDNKADMIVIGRPIYNSKDKIQALKSIKQELQSLSK